MRGLARQGIRREPRNGQQDGRRRTRIRKSRRLRRRTAPSHALSSLTRCSFRRESRPGGKSRSAGTLSPSVMFVGFVDGELVIASSCPLPSPSSRTRARARERRERTVPTAGRAPARRPRTRGLPRHRGRAPLARAGAVSRSAQGGAHAPFVVEAAVDLVCEVEPARDRKTRECGAVPAFRPAPVSQNVDGDAESQGSARPSLRRTSLRRRHASRKTIDVIFSSSPVPCTPEAEVVDSACVPFEQCAEGGGVSLRSQAPELSVRQWPHTR